MLQMFDLFCLSSLYNCWWKKYNLGLTCPVGVKTRREPHFKHKSLYVCHACKDIWFDQGLLEGDKKQWEAPLLWSYLVMTQEISGTKIGTH
jgi:hypothetical protein